MRREPRRKPKADEVMSASNGPFVVVGASLAGLRAVEAARKAGYSGEIVLIGAEHHLPYDRPPLSKSFLLGEVEDTAFRDRSTILDDLGVDLRLGVRATGLDTDRRTVVTTAGEVRYDKLLIATGAHARLLPGAPPLGGIHVLRTRDDADRIKQALVAGARTVVIGAGFIGSELAASAHKLGCEVSVVEAAPVPLVRAVGVEMGTQLAKLHRLNQVPLYCGTSVTGLLGQTHVTGVQLGDGRVLPADLVVVGIGASPATTWLIGTGVALNPVDGGVMCDASLATSAQHVYAAGDVAHWPNEMFGRTMRLENWTGAAEQAAVAAHNALGLGPVRTYEAVPFFWSDWYGQRIQFVGAAEGAEVTVVRGSVEAGRLVALYRFGNRITGALTVNEPRQIMKLRRLIADHSSYAAALESIGEVGTPTPMRTAG
jgi:NADPH-dependent 2,4-dienoyl-CoA reductase/sulfur reductase-like enzyme